MNIKNIVHVLCSSMLGALVAIAAVAQQVEPPAPPPTPPDAVESEDLEPVPERDLEAQVERDDRAPFRWRSRAEDVIVHVGEDAHLPAEQRAQAVVSIFGSAHAAGEVDGAVVALFGDARADARVRENVVALFGDVYVDSRVGREVVAVFGSVRLGPNADVRGDVVAVDGRVIRDVAAQVGGGTREITFGDGLVRLDWLKPWVDHALLYGRPLAIEPGLSWAWTLAFAFLAFYVLLALMFGDAVNRCVQTLEQHPGPTLLTAILTLVLTPITFVLLLITVLGVLVIPFLAAALFFAGLFGRAVVFGWIGRRVTRFTGVGVFAQAAFPVLIGGLVIMGLYLTPVLGFIVYVLVGVIGLGAVLYTIMLALQTKRDAAAGVGAVTAAPVAAAAPTPETTAASPEAREPMVGLAATAPRAGFWIRMAALFIDAVLVGVIFNILGAPDEIWLLALAGYGVLMWKIKSTTIGGIICNLQVVRADGRDVDWDTALVRALSCFLSLAAAGLGFIWIAFDPERQAWHDKIAGTVVVRVKR